MQRATCTGIRIRSPADARVIFHAVLLDVLPMVTRRLDTEERSLISPGSVYVWEERGPHAELTGVGIERWTDGIRWGPSRVREGFLFYHEKQTSQHLYVDGLYDSDGPSSSHHDASRSVLIKQTYTVFVDTPRGQRKWHLIAYFTEESIDRLRSIDDIPQLASLHVPHGKYKSARSAKGRPDHIFNPETDSPEFSRLEYVPYAPRRSPSLKLSPSSHHPLTWIESPPTDSSQLNQKRPQRRRGPGSSASSDDSSPDGLAPLAYLQTIPPPRRHPVDEKTLMLFSSSGLL
ncbi:Gti1/Pac2 family-domain-containing protein [Crucibulum laeve]|uniref:Gti1/Pac2 family-domain-containing protein n=1 Tax=Crucibulum laeve TaxID=68775 RepID=A0A5C3MHA8_9AGAR|nr:Gti1/Pac2 family-domain-containing protein [Crucibulum laeve]